MSKLHTRKTELETRRAQQRDAVSTNPNDRAAADALRQTESELATVNTQIIRGPGAPGVIGAARGRAAIAARRNPQSAQALPMPAPTATPDAPKAAPRYSFQRENDVPMPMQARSVGEQTVRNNGR